MKSEIDHGIGDTAALMDWIDWALDHGVSFLQLLPINALGSDKVPSPYAAISSIALEPIYLTLREGWVPGLEETPHFSMKDFEVIAEPDSVHLVDYTLVRQWKLKVLRHAYEHFSEEIKYHALMKEFLNWVEVEGAWLQDFVDYKLAEKHFGSTQWWLWEEQNPDKVRQIVARYPEGRIFEQWLQWLCHRQWQQVRVHADARRIKLMGDIPIGISLSSSDVFFNRELFNLDWSAGSPPEGGFDSSIFREKWGQNWGVPLYRWDIMARDDYAWWRTRIKRTTDIFQMFRIDHILGFYRIYAFPWKPNQNKDFLPLSYDEAWTKTGGHLPGFIPRPDDSDENKHFNLHEGDKYLKIILSSAPGIDIIGEDLGYVPDYVRPHLRMLNIPGFIIPHWEIKENGEILMGKDYHECSFATFATHDFPPIAVTWNEIFARYARGAEAEKENNRDNHNPDLNDHDRWVRRESRQGLLHEMHSARRSLHWFGAFCHLPDQSVELPWNAMAKTAMFLSLFNSNSRFVCLMYTDLFDLPDRLNLPGTEGGQNWRPRMEFTAKEAYDKHQSTWIKRIIIQTGRSDVLMIPPAPMEGF